ncbi:hypothetical protein VM1G_01628 [Cytospora mali]|uniref:Uncharacterized protein n=1 Tax=Cytospora mali TaxID=578113 RepID=A0A194VRP9_CYTMA|nr:hypothetical protein VM1G_01628 [Valsa mali]
MAMRIASRTLTVAMSKPHLVRSTIGGVRAASSASSPGLDLRPRNSRPSGRMTVFTGPNSTKKSVIGKIVRMAFSARPGSQERAAVILASPKHASWLTDKLFMTDLVSALEGARAAGPSFHVLAAVVDGLSPRPPSRELQEGLSIHLGLRDNLLPGLWDNTSPEGEQPTPPRGAEAEPSSSLSILLPQNVNAKEARISLTLPLANTLFQNGKRSTLLVSKWGQAEGSGKLLFEMVRMAEKRSQVINLPSTFAFDKVTIRAPLAPVTQPRKVLEALGNILAKIEINGEPSPASKELQTNIPRLLEARRALPQAEAASGRVGVWALIYPEHMFSREVDMMRFYSTIGGRYLGKALGKMAYDMSTDPERLAWETQPVLRNAFFRGARLHRILGGGGEWGAKASLLSLDPHTSHGRDTEEDRLNKFIKSFHSEDDAKDAIAKPGDFVQFFVERDPVQLALDKKDYLAAEPTDYPPFLFGVGDTNMKDIDPPSRVVELRRVTDTESPGWVTFDHFGGHSAEGIYLSAGSIGPNTKLDVPGASVNMTSAKHVGVNSVLYRSFKRPVRLSRET